MVTVWYASVIHRMHDNVLNSLARTAEFARHVPSGTTSQSVRTLRANARSLARARADLLEPLFVSRNRDALKLDGVERRHRGHEMYRGKFPTLANCISRFSGMQPMRQIEEKESNDA